MVSCPIIKTIKDQAKRGLATCPGHTSYEGTRCVNLQAKCFPSLCLLPASLKASSACRGSYSTQGPSRTGEERRVCSGVAGRNLALLVHVIHQLIIPRLTRPLMGRSPQTGSEEERGTRSSLWPLPGSAPDLRGRVRVSGRCQRMQREPHI